MLQNDEIEELKKTAFGLEITISEAKKWSHILEENLDLLSIGCKNLAEKDRILDSGVISTLLLKCDLIIEQK